MEKIPVAEVKKNFSELLSAAAYGNEEYIITRHGKEIAVLMGIKKFKDMEKKRNNHQSKGLVELVGNWDGGDEFSRELDKIYGDRKKNVGREVNIGD